MDYIVTCVDLPPSTTRSKRYKIENFHYLDMDISSEFIGNILSREPNFMLAEFEDPQIRGDYYGWALSEKEFDKIKEMIHVYPTVQKFNKLSK